MTSIGEGNQSRDFLKGLVGMGAHRKFPREEQRLEAINSINQFLFLKEFINGTSLRYLLSNFANHNINEDSLFDPREIETKAQRWSLLI